MRPPRPPSVARATVLLALAAGLGGCAAPAPPPERPAVAARWLQDGAFAAPAVPVSTDGLFAVDDAMRRWLAEELGPPVRRLGAKEALVDALLRRDGLRLAYDGTATRRAADAFAARSGNCLSLVVLTAALAGELGLPVRFQSAVVEDAWSREGELHVESGHVNVTIAESPLTARRSVLPQPATIDFLPPADIARLPLRPIGVERVEAMFANNRAVEALSRGAVDDAYAWARHAVGRDPAFASAWNTLGVVYLRRGLPGPAAAVFEAVASAGNAGPGRAEAPAALEPTLSARSRALSNLATALEREGRPREADAARARLAAIDPHPPLHFYRLGRAAAAAGDWEAARAHFAREARRSDGWHEFHFWHAVAAARVGDAAEAARALALAGRTSPDAPTRDRYAGKLAALRAAAAAPVLR
jgi:tetratricopeptide (TPR) repeat protein